MSIATVRGEDLLRAVNAAGPLDLALLLRPTGTHVASWARNGAVPNVLSVMAATMLASVETIVETLGGSRPAAVAVEAPPYRTLAVRVDSRNVLFLAASQAVRSEVLAEEGRRITRELLHPVAGRSPPSGPAILSR